MPIQQSTDRAADNAAGNFCQLDVSTSKQVYTKSTDSLQYKGWKSAREAITALQLRVNE